MSINTILLIAVLCMLGMNFIAIVIYKPNRLIRFVKDINILDIFVFLITLFVILFVPAACIFIYSSANSIWSLFSFDFNSISLNFSDWISPKLPTDPPVEGESSVSSGDYGPFGDFIGGVLNPILTFITVALLVLTMWMQRKELSLTRDELKRSAEEQARSAKAANSQVAYSFIFSIMSLADNKLDRIRYRHASGLQAFNEFVRLDAFKSSISRKDSNHYYRDLKYGEETFSSYYGLVYNLSFAIDSYDESVLDSINKKFYFNLIRSKLSSAEMTLLILHALEKVSDDGEFKLLLIKYEMFKFIGLQGRESCAFNFSGNVCIEFNLLYEYLVVSDDGSECVASAFGKNSKLTLAIVDAIKANKAALDRCLSYPHKDMYCIPLKESDYLAKIRS